MFTGLVEDVGEVVRAESRGGSVRLVIRTSLPVEEIGQGDSVAVDGACFTVVDNVGGALGFDVGPESLERTVAGSYRAGTRVNLERALCAGERLGGHFVLGHVDALGTVERITPRGDAFDFVIGVPADVMDLTPPKGSITLNGISLTVNESHERSLVVSIIPHTWEKTTLRDRRPGDRLNVETDMLARTVAWLLARHGTLERAPRGFTEDTLRKAGFL